MSNENAINIALLIFCILINIIIFFFMLISETKKEKQSRILSIIISVNLVLLISYLTGQFIVGKSNPAYNPILTWTSAIYQVSTQVLLLLHIKLSLQTIAVKSFPTAITRYMAYTAASAVGLNLIMSAASPFTHWFFYYDENNMVVFQELFMISNVTTFIWTVLTTIILISNKKFLSVKEIWSLMSYVILPTIALILFIMVGGTIQFIIFSITLSITIFFAGIQIDLQQRIKQQELELKQKELELSHNELELTQSRIATMTSQIQPHFIFNALASIKSMIRVDPNLATETLAEFSDYLRSNIDSLSVSTPISFENELKHIETYLSIEQKRFRDKLKITYDITVKDFRLPQLSVQPIVENAVRHGITSRKKDGGSIKISSYEKYNDIIITIADDGVGFDTSQITSDKEQINVGIENVRTRLAAMVGGTLEVQSKPGTGTTVTIKIPRR